MSTGQGGSLVIAMLVGGDGVQGAGGEVRDIDARIGDNCAA